MCGFFGNYACNGNKIVNASNLREIANTFSHRGPDGSGFYENSNLGLAFKRLSIIDIKNGNQPFISNNKKFVIVFNGEIYNFSKLKSELENSGVFLKTNSDTEVLIEGLSKWGFDFLKKVNGMFSFALCDIKENKIFLVRDRLGIKPLFYSKVGDNYLFASEIQILLKTKLIEKKVNLDAVSSYMSFRNPIGVGSYFENITEVEPGEIVTIKKGSDKFSYWQIPLNNHHQDLGEKFYIESTINLLKTVVNDHMVSDVPIGSLLSGGLDSSLLTALMNKNKLKTFSASFYGKGYDEIEFAKIVSKKIDSEHMNIVLDSDSYIDKLNSNIQKKCTPLSIPHEIALNELFKKIKNHTKVVMSGEGADELFGGYGRVQSSGFDFKKIIFIKKYFPKSLQGLALKIVGARKYNWQDYNSQLDHFFDIYSWFAPSSKKNVMSKDFITAISDDKKIKVFWSNEFNKIHNLDEYNKIFYIFQKHHLRCLLDRLDFHSMSSGVEARVPFCDHRLVEHVMRIPFKYKIKWKSIFHKTLAIFNNSFQNSENLDISKFLLKQCSVNFVPKIIINRKKKGFPVPLDDWFLGDANSFAKEILLDGETKRRNLFNFKEVESLLSNKENLNFDFWGKKIWMLVNVEIWYRNVVSK
jgi:asparagine synthase (glutamine-hydrolysing)